MTPLARELRAIIASEGPISVERYMALCLQHPVHGYYIAQDAIGRAGDFITAPEVDQMFGELLGLWAAQVWLSMDAPPHLLLVELGPGRGTLMADALRATRIVPGFAEAIDVRLVETSPKLRAAQAARLEGAAARLAWHAAIEELPEGPAIVLANEFFDALPVRHYVRGPAGWHERQIGLDADGRLAFGIAPEPIEISAVSGAPGQILEVGHAASRAMTQLARRIVVEGGALLVCDYGHAQTSLGETLQAMQGHAYADPLVAPGAADLTAHVDFAALARTAAAAGADVHGPIAQGLFLRRLGIEMRAETLRRRADARQADAIETALARFIAPTSTMATLFKVLALTPRDAPAPPGFEETP